MTDAGAVDFDVAIVGAGVAGLTLAWMLADGTHPGLSVLLVDGARDEDELRTLSFWSAGPMPLDPLVRHRWSALRLTVDGATSDVRAREHTYRTLFFADLQRAAKARLATDPRHRVVEGRVQAIAQDADGATLTVSRPAEGGPAVGERRFRARWVLDSRFHLRDLAVDEGRYHLLHQHFHGWIVRTPSDAFDPDVATLLDFRVPAAQATPGTAFFYVLPFGAREALVELVTLAPVDAEPLVRGYLSDVHGADDVRLVDRESGVSPLTEQPFAWRDGARVRRVGVASGRLKPSTGYALTRIVTECTDVVRCLDEHGHPFAPPAGSRAHRGFHRFLDGVLLEVWQEHPAAIPPVFGAMFTRNPVDRVLRFLDEEASAGEILRLVLSLPWTPFLQAVLRLTARRSTRALRTRSARIARSARRGAAPPR